MDYRNDARGHLHRAREELATNSDQRLKFAALELRMSMECLTYDRALAFKDEFPPKEYDTWQPRKVMLVLLDIDAMADKDSSLSFGVEEIPGVPASAMQSMGVDKVLSMSIIKKHYDALGSYLHVQSMKQSRDRLPVDFTRMRSRCEEIASYVEAVLASPIFNVIFANHASMECMKCGKPIRKRMPDGQKQVEAECFECDASYTIADEGDGKVLWCPHQRDVKCGNPSCEEIVLFWTRELKIGLTWTCRSCEGLNELGLGIRYVAPNRAV